MGNSTPDGVKRPLVRRPSTWLAVGAAAVAVTVIVVAAIVLPGASTEGASPSPTAPTPDAVAPTTTPAPGETAAPATTIDEDLAATLVQTTISAVAVAPAESDPAAFLANVATGSYLKEIEAQYIELEADGWTLTGEPVVVHTSIISMDTEANPATAVASVCIDSSAVTTLDAAGAPVAGATTPRALHLFSLVQQADGSWLISAHSFPDDPTC